MEIEKIISQYCSNDKEALEFTKYIANRFDGCDEIAERDFGFLEKWNNIISYAEMFGCAKAVNDKVCPRRPVDFKSPEAVEIKMYESQAGRIPIIYVNDTDDFERLVTNIAYKGISPDNISQTGASFISGKTTRFIILSSKPYSNVPASELGLTDEKAWIEKSVILRRGHECTHYFTLQTYGIANNILHDETIADFIGMYEAFGCYKAQWFLRFMGIIEGSGNRMLFYTKGLSPNTCKAISELLISVAYSLEGWSVTDGFKALSVAERIEIMCRKGLADMAKGF